MHILSKVLLGMVVLVAIIGVVLTSKLRLARGAWLERVEQRKTQLATTQEELRKKRLVVAEAQNEVNRLMTLWGSVWPAQGQVVNPQLGAIVLNIGGNNGLGRRQAQSGSQLPAFYVFAQSPQGAESQYIGEFRPTGIQAAQTAAQLTRPPYQGEAQSWPQGQWRIRESIPSNWRAIFSGLHARTVEALQDVQDQTALLATADELNAKSQEQLQRRLSQLEGKADALEGTSQEVIDGLVASLRKSETDRNTDLGRLDDLRHEYDRKYRELLALIEKNRELESSLPQPASESAPADGQQAIETSTQPSLRR